MKCKVESVRRTPYFRSFSITIRIPRCVHSLRYFNLKVWTITTPHIGVTPIALTIFPLAKMGCLESNKWYNETSTDNASDFSCQQKHLGLHTLG